jgi:shikimate kinase
MSCVIELVGPAGTGKSTLEKILLEKNPECLSMFAPSPRTIRDIPFFLSNLFQILPKLLRSSFSETKSVGRREVAWLSIINGWYKKINKNPNRIIILNQGPIYLITALYCFGSDVLHEPIFSTFWDNIFNYWAKTVNLIILLDASDNCLFQRINDRDQLHVMKTKKPIEVSEFMEEWREGYSSIIDKLVSLTSGPKLICVNTELSSPSETADQILEIINLQCRKNV